MLRYKDALRELFHQGYRSVEIAGWRAYLKDYLDSLGASGPPCAIVIGFDEPDVARIVPLGSTGWLDLHQEPFAIAHR